VHTTYCVQHVQVQQMVADKQPMDANVVSDVAVATMKHFGRPELLQENGGRFKAGKSWCNTLLEECHLKRRKCTTQAQKLPENWRALGHRLMLQVWPPAKHLLAKLSAICAFVKTNCKLYLSCSAALRCCCHVDKNILFSEANMCLACRWCS
jgi:hypothetical protein